MEDPWGSTETKRNLSTQPELASWRHGPHARSNLTQGSPAVLAASGHWNSYGWTMAGTTSDQQIHAAWLFAKILWRPESFLRDSWAPAMDWLEP